MTHAASGRYQARLLSTDAKNRALRVFLVGITLDVLTAVGLFFAELSDDGLGQVNWSLLGALVLKTLAASAGSYVLRMYGDPSSLPTPLPPSPPGEPSEHL